MCCAAPLPLDAELASGGLARWSRFCAWFAADDGFFSFSFLRGLAALWSRWRYSSPHRYFAAAKPTADIRRAKKERMSVGRQGSHQQRLVVVLDAQVRNELFAV